MRHRLVPNEGLILAVLLWAGSATAAPATSAPTAAVLPLSAKVEGRGYAELSAQWWRWTDGFPSGMEPYRDRDGHWCEIQRVRFIYCLFRVAPPQWLRTAKPRISPGPALSSSLQGRDGP